MSIKAILTVASLLVGSSSLVLADPQPSVTFGVGVGPRDPAPYTYPYSAPYPAPSAPYAYPYRNPPAYQYSPAPYPYQYQYLNPPPGYGAPSGFINGREWIGLDGATGRISLFTYGQTYVRAVDIYYLDGSVRRLRIHRALGPGNPRFDILIGRRPIRGISIRGGGAGLSASVSY